MRKFCRSVFTFCFLIIGLAVYGQEFGFDLHDVSLDEFIQIEVELGSERIENIRKSVSYDGTAQPILFKRNEKVIPDLVVNYFFKKQDSTISYIRYEWDESMLTLKHDNDNKKTKKYQKLLKERSLEIEQKISSRYGNPAETDGNLTDLKIAFSGRGLSKKNIWKPNDSLEIEMYTTVSNFREKRGAVTISPTHRIRLYIRNIKQENNSKPSLSEEKIDSLEKTTLQFISTLADKNFTKSKKFLSAQIIEIVTEEQLKKLVGNWDFTKKIILVNSGIQFRQDGNMFTILDFTYKLDNDKPAEEILKIIFDGEDKVIGVQPLKYSPTKSK